MSRISAYQLLSSLAQCHQRVHGKWHSRVLGHVECARTKQWIITIHHRVCLKRYQDESLVRDTQLPAIFVIERIEVCMTFQTLIVRHIRQEWIIWIKEITIHMTLDSQVVCRWRQFKPWSLTKTINCCVITNTIKVPPFSYNIEFLILFLNRNRYKRKHFHHFLAHSLDELGERVIICGHW